MTTTVHYTVYDDKDAWRCYTVTLAADYDLEAGTWNDSVAEQCAEDWHKNHAGWDAQWPRIFTLFASKDGPPLARFQIELETTPVFSAVPA